MMTPGTLGEMVMRRYSTLGEKKLGRPRKITIKTGRRRTKPTDIQQVSSEIKGSMLETKKQYRAGSVARFRLMPRKPPISAYKTHVESLTKSYTKAK